MDQIFEANFGGETHPVKVQEPRWKLVRDKLPEIANDGVFKTESPVIFEAALRLKLVEETEEVLQASTRAGLIDEMVDVMEVLSALGRHHKIGIAELNAHARDKREKRGSFSKGIFMLVPVAPKRLDTKCSVCNEQQFETPSGATCSNGHGGAEGVPIDAVDA